MIKVMSKVMNISEGNHVMEKNRRINLKQEYD